MPWTGREPGDDATGALLRLRASLLAKRYRPTPCMILRIEDDTDPDAGLDSKIRPISTAVRMMHLRDPIRVGFGDFQGLSGSDPSAAV